ncbi:LysE family transporter [Staphylococcus equorum]|uniref:Transporter n=3 Tax=Staphylococcus equorum TaxID=246432 RepID=A0A1E5TG22_9STAP|nr:MULTISPECIES: LysE family transporter [Staphylococcus]ERH35706.1 transporter [Staphylococcus equorum UMC-CNS-924]ALM58198.1 transporter [Staphylococcus equorum]ANK38777.1 putative membrane protein [Staphylococcus sp. AntiMn-1]ANR69222.1 transporter [Staphylococcus equorum]MCE5007820.1 LysE family transporter [Staphylococcus equorum]
MFISFVFYTFFMSYTPGPNNLLALDGALKLGLKGTAKFLIGIGLGFLTLSMLCLLFSEYMAAYFSSFIFVIKIVGFIYLLYLAYSVFKHNAKDAQQSNTYRMRDGLLLQYMNPKTIVYVLTAIVTYVTTQNISFLATLSYTIIIALIGVSGAVAWAVMGLCFKKLLLKYEFIYKVSMSACLVVLAFMMILE